ncbi:uncharacterized protein LOC124929990 [Impatiens glandulifera]|uniref:uncharacterized protein LOC124929990 n=1 Tax=Impatiens glandulifera TaxID=253017 RepID=UPI001FB04F9A|nr:uncharacterized protein LOC124929990 [Impatiens glandulifera]
MAITASRRFMNTLKTILFVLRKGISKAKVIGRRDLHILKKRGKLIQSFLSLHNHIHHHNIQTPKIDEFIKRKQTASQRGFFTCVHSPDTHEDDSIIAEEAVRKAIMEMESSVESSPDYFWSPMVTSDSPMLPELGFGMTRMVKQLRITDSPYPMNMDVGDHNHVNEAAEKFIAKFYETLRKQG